MESQFRNPKILVGKYGPCSPTFSADVSGAQLITCFCTCNSNDDMSEKASIINQALGWGVLSP